MLPTREMAEVTLRTKVEVTNKTVVYVNHINTEDSLPSEIDAKRLGIIEVHVERPNK